MDWNVKSPLQWDWENAAIGTGSVYSSAGGAFSSSDLGNGSSRSSISASIDSSLKAGVKISEFNFENVEGSSPKGLSKNKELARMEDTGTSPVVAAKGGLGEPLIGLKLGKRTYFEDVCAGNSTKNSTASTSVAPVTAIVKKTRVSHQSVPNSRCQVEGCNIDLTGAKDYHRKHRVCESHSKCPKVIIAGQERRFCQQCSRFHELSEFDLKKRSCRRRLSDHNARRRKPLSDTISFNSSRLASSFYDCQQMALNELIRQSRIFDNLIHRLSYPFNANQSVDQSDGRQQMNFVLNRSPFGNMRPTASSTWEDSCGFSLTHSRGSWIKSMKTRGMDGHLHFSNYDLSNTVSSLPQGLDKLMPLKGTTTEVLSQGLGAPVPDPNLDGGPDLRRALSLLSTDSWGSVNPGQSNLSHYVNASHNSSSHPTMQQAVNTSTYWQDQQSLHQQERVVPFDLHNNGSQYQELQLPKAPYETSFFDSGQILSKSDGHFLELT